MIKKVGAAISALALSCCSLQQVKEDEPPAISVSANEDVNLYVSALENRRGQEYVHVEGTPVIWGGFFLSFTFGPGYYREENWITEEMIHDTASIFYGIAESLNLDHREFAQEIEVSLQETDWQNAPDAQIGGQPFVNGKYFPFGNRIALFGWNIKDNRQYFIHEILHRIITYRMESVYNLQDCYNEGAAELLLREGWTLYQRLTNNRPEETFLTAALGEDFYQLALRDPISFENIIDRTRISSNREGNQELFEYIDQFAQNWNITNTEELESIFADPMCNLQPGHTGSELSLRLKDLIEAEGIGWYHFLKGVTLEASPLLYEHWFERIR